jgi:hypothetical protein
LVKYPINKLVSKALNGKNKEVATREDIVSALQNNMLKVEELVTV